MKFIISKQEIIQHFNLPYGLEIEVVDCINEPEKPAKAPFINAANTITVTFPSKTAKEIVEECDNKVGNGKLLYNTEWYKDEDFFKKEKTRKGTKTINLELLHKGKTWDECKELVGEENMLNFAEVVYLMREFPEQLKGVLKDWHYTWTSSRDSDGGLVCAGYFDSGGANVSRRGPGTRTRAWVFVSPAVEL